MLESTLSLPASDYEFGYSCFYSSKPQKVGSTVVTVHFVLSIILSKTIFWAVKWMAVHFRWLIRLFLIPFSNLNLTFFRGLLSKLFLLYSKLLIFASGLQNVLVPSEMWKPLQMVQLAQFWPLLGLNLFILPTVDSSTNIEQLVNNSIGQIAGVLHLASPQHCKWRASERIQYICLAPIYVFLERKLLGLVISKAEL